MNQVTTLVEFFSENTINNVLGCFAFSPRTLIFITDNRLEDGQKQGTLRAVHRLHPRRILHLLYHYKI